ncbi:MAG: hypothetical protein ACTSVZ_04165 [Promethearchaeota archaeon]
MKAGMVLTENEINTVLANINEEVAHFQILEGRFINQIYDITTTKITPN